MRNEVGGWRRRTTDERVRLLLQKIEAIFEHSLLRSVRSGRSSSREQQAVIWQKRRGARISSALRPEAVGHDAPSQDFSDRGQSSSVSRRCAVQAGIGPASVVDSKGGLLSVPLSVPAKLS